MKKYFIFAVAALAASVACTKTNIDTDQLPDQKISFEVANYVPQTRANSGLDTEGYTTFNCYAYFFNGTAAQTYMNNVAVTKTNVGAEDSPLYQWAPAEDYFWPKNSTSYINFYSFAGSKAPIVEATSDKKTITVKYDLRKSYNGSVTYNDAAGVVATNDNILVAYPAMKYNSNVNEVSIDGTDPGYSGVPTLFKHVLAKLEVKVKLATTTASDNTLWEVEVNNSDTDSYITAGDEGTLILKHTEASTPATGHSQFYTPYDTNGTTLLGVTSNPESYLNGIDQALIGWVRSKANSADDTTIPEVKYNFSTATLTMNKGATESSATPTVLSPISVMPQLTGHTGLKLTYTVKAYHGTVSGEEWTRNDEPFMVETRTTGTNPEILGKLVPSIKYWGMNQKITYTIIIDPVTEKVTFDPAVEDLTEVSGDVNVDKDGFVTPTVTP